MSRNNKAAIWLKRLVIAVCIGVVMLSAAIVAKQLQLTDPIPAALLAFFVCLSVIFLTRQFLLRRELDAAKSLAMEAASMPSPESPGKPGGFERLGRSAETPDFSFSADDFPDANTESAPKQQVASALGDDDLALFLQPIVTLPNKEPIFYQTLLRLKMSNGTMLDPPQYRNVAEAGGLMAGIDRRSVTQSIRMLKTLTAMNKTASVFCTLSPGSLKNGKNYDRVIELLERNADIRDHLVLEVSQGTYAGIGSAGRKRLEALSKLGFRLCMSGLSDLQIDLDALSRAGFVFIKAPISLLTSRQTDEAAIYPETLAAHVALRDMHLIATGVSFDQQVRDIMDRDALIAQGDLFAEPKQVRAELLEED